MRQTYRVINFTPKVLTLIAQMTEIVNEYIKAGYVMTARQLYYQLVARDIVPNNLQSYKRVASILNDARIGGLMDWDAIEDRTREFIQRSRWANGSDILHGAAQGYHMDMWENQSGRVFVIIEKEALVGVLGGLCHQYDVPLLAARGYPSVSVLREFALRDLVPTIQRGQTYTILHLGDHDPSGIDMSRDLRERLSMFIEAEIDDEYEFQRIALNMDQIRELRPPPNPSKLTDSRTKPYRAKYKTDNSWELDALDPKYLNDLVERNILSAVDNAAWAERRAEIQAVKDKIQIIADDFSVD